MKKLLLLGFVVIGLSYQSSAQQQVTDSDYEQIWKEHVKAITSKKSNDILDNMSQDVGYVGNANRWTRRSEMEKDSVAAYLSDIFRKEVVAGIKSTSMEDLQVMTDPTGNENILLISDPYTTTFSPYPEEREEYNPEFRTRLSKQITALVFEKEKNDWKIVRILQVQLRGDSDYRKNFAKSLKSQSKKEWIKSEVVEILVSMRDQNSDAVLAKSEIEESNWAVITKRMFPDEDIKGLSPNESAAILFKKIGPAFKEEIKRSRRGEARTMLEMFSEKDRFHFNGEPRMEGEYYEEGDYFESQTSFRLQALTSIADVEHQLQIMFSFNFNEKTNKVTLYRLESQIGRSTVELERLREEREARMESYGEGDQGFAEEIEEEYYSEEGRYEDEFEEPETASDVEVKFVWDHHVKAILDRNIDQLKQHATFPLLWEVSANEYTVEYQESEYHWDEGQSNAGVKANELDEKIQVVLTDELIAKIKTMTLNDLYRGYSFTYEEQYEMEDEEYSTEWEEHRTAYKTLDLNIEHYLDKEFGIEELTTEFRFSNVNGEWKLIGITQRATWI